jgi:MFS family permease
MTAATRGWLFAVSVYFLAVLNRSSLGVAGLLAEHRFHITPAQLSVFVLLQIGVYAAMQVPAGVLVDRYGPRRLLIVAALLMGVAQLSFGLVTSYPVALLARAVLGCGDALTFISVLRYIAANFGPQRFPLLVSLTGMIGTAGNLLATLPLEAVLHSRGTFGGWFAGYAITGVVSFSAGILVWLLLKDRSVPPSRLTSVAEVVTGLRSVRRRVRAAWALPGTRLGFWVHFSTMSTGTAFGVLWGLPYLVKGVGFSSTAASTLLLLGVLLAAAVSPVLGAVIARWPISRVPIALAVIAYCVLAWALVFACFGDHPPKTLVALIFVVTMVGGPASLVGFALARDYNPPAILGTASGVVNVGGFSATVLIAVGFGWVLDGLGGTTPHALRFALLVGVGVQLFGGWRAVVWYRRVRHQILRHQQAGIKVPVRVGQLHWWDLPVGPSETLTQ